MSKKHSAIVLELEAKIFELQSTIESVSSSSSSSDTTDLNAHIENNLLQISELTQANDKLSSMLSIRDQEVVALSKDNSKFIEEINTLKADADEYEQRISKLQDNIIEQEKKLANMDTNSSSSSVELVKLKEVITERERALETTAGNDLTLLSFIYHP